MGKIKLGIQLFRNMGLRYLIFRVCYILKKKAGVLKKRFPTNPPSVDIISLSDWKNCLPPFFFYGKNLEGIRKCNSVPLLEVFNDVTSGYYTFFGKAKIHLGNDFDWITNPLTHYKYDISKHWSEIQDFSDQAGDIKFVWEKARFSFIADIIRYDFHYEKDCSELIFNEIISFIDNNPINKGPNYFCSQEISLRVINWTFALYYYKDSPILTDQIFKKIMNTIYWQIHHVYNNINFSRIAVRNNHAITETLLLYVSGLLFPFFIETKKWSAKGKKWFEQEIAFQIFSDGTYLQFSNNYHRVVIQLMTFGIGLTHLNGQKFKQIVYSRGLKSLEFLYNSMDLSTGWLPNYGSNDGALLFKFNDNHFRDYRSQLQLFSHALGVSDSYNFGTFFGEDNYWFDYNPLITSQILKVSDQKIFSYPDGGFYIARESDSMTYIRCGKHKERPAQADNLHLDIWFKGINFFRDNGSYLYNTDHEFVKYFMGSRSHNTVILDDFDQMLKGPRFTWYYWSQAKKARILELEDRFEFEGTISAFSYLDKKIRHVRKVIKNKSIARWIIEDEIIGTDKYEMRQLWHFNPGVESLIDIKAHDINGTLLTLELKDGWYSSYYGVKEKAKYWQFTTNNHKITTEINIIE